MEKQSKNTKKKKNEKGDDGRVFPILLPSPDCVFPEKHYTNKTGTDKKEETSNCARKREREKGHWGEQATARQEERAGRGEKGWGVAKRAWRGRGTHRLQGR